MSSEISNWNRVLGDVQYVINNILHKSINTTPSKMLLGYDQRNKGDKELWQLIENLTSVDANFEKERQDIRDSVQLANRAIQEYNKKQYDRKRKKITQYKEGDLVLIKVMQHKPGTNQKLQPKFKEPYQIKKLLSKNRFVVTNVPGYNLTQKPYNTILSADKIKPWVRIADPVPHVND